MQIIILDNVGYANKYAYVMLYMQMILTTVRYQFLLWINRRIETFGSTAFNLTLSGFFRKKRVFIRA